MAVNGNFAYTFAALRGTQAGRVFYVAMCPLRLIPKLFLFDEEELPAELRAQRPINRARIPEIARYMLDNPTEYVFSSITASVDGDLDFAPTSDGLDIGKLSVSMEAKFIINDGQHRRAAIEAAISERAELGNEAISVVLFSDGGLQRSQQMFADLNQNAIRPTKSIGILYDLRNPLAQLARQLVDEVEVFRTLTEMEKTSISNRSLKLFTLSSIYAGTKALLGTRRLHEVTSTEHELAVTFWNEVAKHLPEWRLAAAKKANPAELRREFVHSHGLALHALGMMGSALIKSEPTNWKEKLAGLDAVDWTRRNARIWEGRALVAGRVSKATNNVQLTASFLKSALQVPLSKEDTFLEGSLKGSN